MKKVRLEVFIEPGCKACIAAMYSVREVQSRLAIDVEVYRRDSNGDIFRRRKVVITPAIFIDGVLTFYGEVTPDDIKKKIYSVCHV
jgi:predicted thioredoxin/glutaredoxin